MSEVIATLTYEGPGQRVKAVATRHGTADLVIDVELDPPVPATATEFQWNDPTKLLESMMTGLKVTMDKYHGEIVNAVKYTRDEHGNFTRLE